MPGRRIPPEIAAYLGPCREAESIAERVVEQCGLAKFMGDAGLTDFDPLLVVMNLVTEEVEGLGLSLAHEEGRNVWCEVMQMIQDGEASLEHNEFLPCRHCDQAFEPIIDEKLLGLFKVWHDSRHHRDVIAIHTCPTCGGVLKSQRTKRYTGDMHTPEPNSIQDDEEWVERLLQYSQL